MIDQLLVFSGGLDSSLVTSLVQNIIKKQLKRIVLDAGSEDLKYSQMVADYLNKTLIILSEMIFLMLYPM